MILTDVTRELTLFWGSAADDGTRAEVWTLYTNNFTPRECHGLIRDTLTKDRKARTERCRLQETDHHS